MQTTSELQALATVFVVLGLLGEDEAEGTLDAHRRALDAAGVELHDVPCGELTLRSSVAQGLQLAQRRPRESLRHRPVGVAAPGVRMQVASYEVLLEWLVVSPAGGRGGAVIKRVDGKQLPTDHTLAVSVPGVDDRGHSFSLEIRAGRCGGDSWRDGSAATTARLELDPPLPVGSRWLELRPPGSEPCRIAMRLPNGRNSGVAELRWDSPAEWVLDSLSSDVIGTGANARFGIEGGLDVEGALGVISAVGDALLAVGALPPTSPLLTRSLALDRRWSYALARRYGIRAGLALDTAQPRRVAAVGVSFPLRRGVAMLDCIVERAGDVWIHAYVFPAHTGEYWPVSFPLFRIEALDDLGHHHDAIPATAWVEADHERYGDLWLWPPLAPQANRLHFTFSTPWEAVWADTSL